MRALTERAVVAFSFTATAFSKTKLMLMSAHAAVLQRLGQRWMGSCLDGHGKRSLASLVEYAMQYHALSAQINLKVAEKLGCSTSSIQ